MYEPKPKFQEGVAPHSGFLPCLLSPTCIPTPTPRPQTTNIEFPSTSHCLWTKTKNYMVFFLYNLEKISSICKNKTIENGLRRTKTAGN